MCIKLYSGEFWGLLGGCRCRVCWNLPQYTCIYSKVNNIVPPPPFQVHNGWRNWDTRGTGNQLLQANIGSPLPQRARKSLGTFVCCSDPSAQKDPFTNRTRLERIIYDVLSQLQDLGSGHTALTVARKFKVDVKISLRYCY